MKSLTKQAVALVTALGMLAGCGATEVATTSDPNALESVAEEATADTSAGLTDVVAAGTDENAEPHAGSFDYDEAGVVEISLGSVISATSDAVSIDGTTATITSGGAYEIAGTLSDGEIIVDAGDDAVVQIILNGADITNTDGAAIAIMNADTATVILADGSTNTLSDGAAYVFAEGEDEPNATLFSKADLTVGGTGSLTVSGNYNDGIASKDGLVIDSGTITVTAVDDGIRGKDYVVIDGGEIEVTAGGDGIKSDNDEDPERGYIAVADGTIDVTAGDDGLQAATDILIDDGDLVLASGDDAIHGDLFVTINGGSIVISESYEGIEAEVITINGGFIDVTSDDDGLNVAGADSATTVEATDAGVAPDPGTEAAVQPPLVGDETTRPAPGQGGRPVGAAGGGPGGDAGVGEHYIYINGGTITITITSNLAEQGDGIDANGHVVMTGGVVTVSGPTDTRNSAIDYSGGSFVMTGGLFVGTNINGRNSEGIGVGSTQGSLYVTLGSIADAGTLVHIQSADGENLVTFEPVNDYDVVVFSSPHLVAGETYEIYLGGTADGDATTGLNDSYSPGTLVGTATAV